MKKILSFFKEHFISILIILIFCIASSRIICQNDLFFDINTGKSILNHGLDFKEHFSWIPGLTYLYLHWLYDIIIYFLFSLFSFNGLFVLFTFCFCIFSIVFYNQLYKEKESKLLAVIFTLFMIITCNYAFVSRVQSIIYLLLFLEVIFLEKLYTTGKKKYSLYLVLLSILVVNLQMPIWIFYAILTLPFVAELIFYYIGNKLNFEKKINVHNSCNPKLFLLTILFITISGFMSPLIYHPYVYFLKSLNNPIYKLIKIGEMQNTVLIESKIIIIIQMFFIIGLFFKFIKISFRDFCLFCGLFIFSLLVNKNVIFFVYMGIYLLYKNIDMKKIINKLKKAKSHINLRIIKLLLCFILILELFIVIKIKKEDFENYGVDTYPVEIADYIIENIDYKHKKFFTDFNNGSYFAFREIPIFIDSRAEVYIKEYNGGFDILTDYNNLFSFNKYRDLLDKYEFDYLILIQGTDLYNFVDKEMDYCIVYSYHEYSIFEHTKDNKILN